MSLCIECNHKRNCKLTNNFETVHSCSEYDPVKTFQELNSITGYNSKEPSKEKSNALCYTCLIRKECVFFSEERPILYCELYQ